MRHHRAPSHLPAAARALSSDSWAGLRTAWRGSFGLVGILSGISSGTGTGLLVSLKERSLFAAKAKSSDSSSPLAGPRLHLSVMCLAKASLNFLICWWCGKQWFRTNDQRSLATCKEKPKNWYCRRYQLTQNIETIGLIHTSKKEYTKACSIVSKPNHYNSIIWHTTCDYLRYRNKEKKIQSTSKE